MTKRLSSALVMAVLTHLLLAAVVWAQAPPAPSALPDYLRSAGMVEKPVEVVTDSVRLPALLTLPDSTGKGFPIVVLVHGSGPNDKDETVGPNKPFRDLAYGLAKQGIATLRYDKRTRAGYTQVKLLEDEVILDALSALRLAKSFPQVDSAKVFLLGHSLGATVAPYIARRAPGLAGVIALAGLTQPWDATLLRQMKTMMQTQGVDSVSIAVQQKQLREGFERIKSGSLPDDSMFFYAPASYWRDLFALHQAEAAAQSKLPFLFLQGGYDHQVLADQDYTGWQQAFAAAKKPFTGKVYPTLNHLFIAQDKAGSPLDIMKPGWVAPEVITDLAAWIKTGKLKP